MEKILSRILVLIFLQCVALHKLHAFGEAEDSSVADDDEQVD